MQLLSIHRSIVYPFLHRHPLAKHDVGFVAEKLSHQNTALVAGFGELVVDNLIHPCKLATKS